MKSKGPVDEKHKEAGVRLVVGASRFGAASE